MPLGRREVKQRERGGNKTKRKREKEGKAGKLRVKKGRKKKKEFAAARSLMGQKWRLNSFADALTAPAAVALYPSSPFTFLTQPPSLSLSRPFARNFESDFN